ncbi:hypothetical protein NEAUS03_1833 [Nematocida ausubeli]|nr:hypothetical protein NEAUS03_1833 [Nematocida ausubeli]
MILSVLDLEHGKERMEEKLRLIEHCDSLWPELKLSQKIILLNEELSKRKEPLEKQIFSWFKSHVAHVGIPFEEWDEEHYNKAIEELLNYIEKESKTALSGVPEKGKGSWEEWFQKFMGYIMLKKYSFEDIKTEFRKRTATYPREFLEVWEQDPQELNDAYKRLGMECRKQDDLNRGKKKDSRKKSSYSGLTCRVCGVLGHIARICRKAGNKDERSSNSYGSNSYGKNFAQKKNFNSYRISKKSFQKGSNI